MPLIVCVVYATGLPPRVKPVSAPLGAWVGSMACSPFALAPGVIVKLNVPAFQLSPLNAELERASTQVSSCLAVITGTPRACADSTAASDTEDCAESVWALTVYTP